MDNEQNGSGMDESSPQITIPELTPDERQGLQEYWNIYEAYREPVTAQILEMAGQHPEFKYQPLALPEETGDSGRVRWVSGIPGEKPEYAGTDFIVARDGKIAAVYLFFDKLPN